MSIKKHGYLTLEEHHAQLKAEGKWDEYVALKEQTENDRKKLWEERKKAEVALVSAIRAAGVDVQSVADLVGRKASYSEAIPVLLEHLKQDYPDWVKEYSLRALGIPEARKHWLTLVDFLEKNSLNLPQDIRYVAAIALDGAADESVADDVIRMAADRSLGVSRVPLIFTLQRLKSPRARMLLLELRKDPDIGREVKKLRRLERLGLPFK